MRKTATKDSKGFQKLEVGWRSRSRRRSWESGFALIKSEVLLRSPCGDGGGGPILKISREVQAGDTDAGAIRIGCYLKLRLEETT